MTESIRVNLPCPCGKMSTTYVHFEVVDMFYESEPGPARAVGDLMPDTFPERDMEVEGISDPCIECGNRQQITISFKGRRIANLRRSPGWVRMDSMPVIEIPIFMDEYSRVLEPADQLTLQKGLASPAGLKAP